MSRLARNLLIGFLGLIALVVVIALVYIFITIRSSFPQTSGNLQLVGLDAPVDVYRDQFGIPQIYAQTTHDLFFAQGYVHAQDRFWQMDFWRHIGSGRLSEMLGDSTLDEDKVLRTLGWARVVQQELDQIDPENLSYLKAYSEGVNAFLDNHKGSALSLEYAVLKLTNPGYEPEPWTPLNTLTWAKVMAWDLGGNMDSEIKRAILLKTLTPQQLDELTPPYPADKPVILPAGSAMVERDNQFSLASNTQLWAEVNPALLEISRKLRVLDGWLGSSGDSLGSNNWVISGQLTSTGMPFLANDPHLAAQMPSIWYEIGLHCQPKGPDCPYEVTGFSFAGVPAVIIGHNDRIAWGFTNVGPDVQDLFIEKVNPDNPNQYEVNGQWVDMDLVHETIQVGGGEPVPLTVRYTRHGPIISDTYLPTDFTEKAGIELPSPYAIALRWTALEPSRVFEAIFGFNRAQNWDEFRQAARDFAVPSQNLVYADVDGNIGYQMPGWVPIRANGDGRLPVPGWTDEYEWTGYIPFEQLPFASNPTQGYIATANNAVVGSEYPYLITTEWDYGFRAQRIVNMIESAGKPIDISYIQQMQGDDKNLNAQNLVPILLQIPLNDSRLENARQILQDWDYQETMASSPGALFEVFWKHLLADAFQDDLPEDYWPEGSSRWFEVVHQLVQQPDSPWWDIQTTPQVEQRDQIFKQAFSEAVDELESSQGKSPSGWSWGKLHTLTFVNQTLGVSGIAPIEALFNRGPFQTSGSSSIVNATGWDASLSYEVTSLPSMRMIVDLSDLENSLSIHTTGESGHAYHPNYVDMANLWRNIQYLPMLWERNQVEANAKDHLQLAP